MNPPRDDTKARREASRFARADGTRTPGGGRMLSLRLTPDEWACLDEAALRAGVGRSSLVRQALDAAGLLGSAPIGTVRP